MSDWPEWVKPGAEVRHVSHHAVAKRTIVRLTKTQIVLDNDAPGEPRWTLRHLRADRFQRQTGAGWHPRQEWLCRPDDPKVAEAGNRIRADGARNRARLAADALVATFRLDGPGATVDAAKEALASAQAWLDAAARPGGDTDAAR